MNGEAAVGGATPVVLFAGGGTVGHLAPGFALADALEARGVVCEFATPGEAREAAWFAGRASPRTIPADRLPRRPWRLPGFLLRLRRHARAAEGVLRACGAGFVVALGGWPCVPAVVAARRAGIPYGFVVPDEVPGLVVRRFRRRAARFWTASPVAARRLGPRALVVGPLLRREALEAVRDPARFGLRPDRATLLVTGGSQGSAAINRFVIEGVRHAIGSKRVDRDAVQVIHATGFSDEAWVRAAYEELGIVHHVAAFVSPMGPAYAMADFAIGRGGAGTCAELHAWGLPAAIVPYPHHRDRQQERNAEALVAAGLAVVLDEHRLAESDFASVVLEPMRTSRRRPRVPPTTSSAADRAADDLLSRIIPR